MSHVPSQAFIDQWTSTAETRTGVQICLRPLRPDDREREVAFIASLSERSRYLRMFTPLKVLPPHLLDPLMDIDYDGRMAFVATIRRDDGNEEIVGIARYGETDQKDVVELGITVTDAWQGQGLASLLLKQLMRFAQWRGKREMTGVVLAENAPMIGLARSLGFEVRFDAANHVFEIRRNLNDMQDRSEEQEHAYRENRPDQPARAETRTDESSRGKHP